MTKSTILAKVCIIWVLMLSPTAVERISIEESADDQSYEQWIEIEGIQNGIWC